MDIKSFINQVMAEILNFRCLPQQVKSRMESLMEREYLERDTEDQSKIVYLPWLYFLSLLFICFYTIFWILFRKER